MIKSLALDFEVESRMLLQVINFFFLIRWVMILLVVQDNMTMDYEERHIHGKPQNSFHKAVNIPDIVVFPR